MHLVTPDRPRAVTPRVVALLAVAALAAGCGGPRAAPEPGGKLEVAAAETPADTGTVDLRVYLRAGEGSEAHLVPVTRAAGIRSNLPRRALELLIAGPGPQDPADLTAALPTGTGIQAFDVQGDTAVVDLTADAITAAHEVRPSPEHELLALAAVANTLTEFPAIDYVRLTVAGGRELWGGWGLPEVLSRDEQVIGPPRPGDPLPPLDRFTTEPQRIGSTEAAAVSIRQVRTVDRLGFVRVIVELSDAGGQVPATGVPPVFAQIQGDRLVLKIDDVVSSAAEPGPGQRLVLEHLPFDALEAEAGPLPGPARFALPVADKPFWLHTLTSPTRVVLDVRK